MSEGILIPTTSPATDTGPRARVRRILLRRPVEAPRERPILFSSNMIKAILAGTKLQTRRTVTRRNSILGSGEWPHNGLARAFPQTDHSKLMLPGEDEAFNRLWPRWDVGDRLWARETCRAEELPSGLDGVRYLADDSFTPIENSEEASEKWFVLACYGMKKSGTAEYRKVPAIHMPRWASRILLEISKVRVERLNDISEADAKAEGVSWNRNPGAVALHGAETARDAYRTLWDQINGAGSWNANPWVWRISFRRITP